MAITTTIARHFAWKTIIMGIVCLVFGVWGAFDLWGQQPLSLGVTTLKPIPYKERVMAQYEPLKEKIAEYERRTREGPALSLEERSTYEETKRQIDDLAPGGAEPLPPGSWDRPTQWAFISCLLMVPYCFWTVFKTSRRVYKLDDDGTLHLPEGVWPPNEVADIDMSRWMAKSIAWVVHTDGRRVMLDDYKHRNLHLIVGAVAARLHPDLWDDQAKPIKPKDEEAPAEEASEPAHRDQEPAQPA